MACLADEINKFRGAYCKRLLSLVWPDLRFIPRTGMTDLVCSMSITIRDALLKQCLLKHIEAQ